MHSSPVNEQLRAENDLLRAKSQGWSPQIKQEPTPVKDEPESGEYGTYIHELGPHSSLTTGVDHQISTSAAHQPTAVKSEPQESLEIPCEIAHLMSL